MFLYGIFFFMRICLFTFEMVALFLENTFIFLISHFSGSPRITVNKRDGRNLFRTFCYTNAYNRHSVVFYIYAINVFLYFLLIVKLDAGMYAVPLSMRINIGSHIILYTKY